LNFLSELSRRNVIRVTGLYVVAGWIVLQVITTVAPILGLPDWFDTAVLVLLLAGLPFIAIGAWAFEMTPEGLRREQSAAPDAPSRVSRLDIGILVALVVLIGVGAWLNLTRAPTVVSQPAIATSEDESGDSHTSIAVLAFDDLSEAGDQEYFADGISEEILNLLVRVEGLQVASRTSSFQYKNRPLGISEIANELGVDHVLEGSLRRAGDSIRITAQLIDARTDRHLWSDNFDRDITDIFAIQDEIADAIVQALADSLGLAPEDANVDVRAVTANLDAYDAYIQGREYFLRRVQIEEAIALLEHAVELDPDFVEAWEVLALSYVISSSWTDRDVIESAADAVAAANRVLEINPDSSMAYAALGAAAGNTPNGNILELIVPLERSLELDPNNIVALDWYATNLATLGYFHDARDILERCLEIDPGYTKCRSALVEIYYLLGEPELALEALLRVFDEGYGIVSPAAFDVFLANGLREEAILLTGAQVGFELPLGRLIDAMIDPENNNTEDAYAVAFAEAEANPENFSEANLYFVAVRYGIEPLPELTFDVLTNINLWYPYYGEARNSDLFKGLAAEFGVLGLWQERGYPPQCRPVGYDDFHCDAPHMAAR
jgi:TolB-like protein/uncharacterized membrane protein YhdT